MRKGRIYLIVLAVVLASVLYAAMSNAGLSVNNPQDPLMKEGEIFAVKIIPGGKKMQVLITGREVGNLSYTDLGLSASLKIGNRTFTLEPQRKNDSFELQAPAQVDKIGSDSRLQLKIRYGQKDENFEFNLKPKAD